MKQLLLLISLLPTFAFSQGEYNGQFGFYTPIEIPIRSEMPNMSPNIGFGVQGSYRPFPNVPIFVELKGNLGVYSAKTSKETYLFGDGSSTITDVHYRSSMNKIMLGTKIYFTSFYKPVRGFITLQIGYNAMRSRIRIDDPEDTDGCTPLENNIAHRNGGFTYGGEIGVDLDVKKIFKGEEAVRGRMYVSLAYLSSFKELDYINIKYMSDHEHGMEMANDDNRDVTTQFLNISSNNVHEHKIAEVYRTKLNFVTINIGYIWYL